ncbi:hypothetical protein Q604_UNBC03872G0001, partial [human gut metagenome]
MAAISLGAAAPPAQQEGSGEQSTTCSG